MSSFPARRGAHVSLVEAIRGVAAASPERSVLLYEHGTLTVKIYAPRGVDPQTPHTRDEIYVVASGTGSFFDGRGRRPFAPGDFFFAPAGSVHRFEQFTDDFATWVMYFGPEGGEASAGR